MHTDMYIYIYISMGVPGAGVGSPETTLVGSIYVYIIHPSPSLSLPRVQPSKTTEVGYPGPGADSRAAEWMTMPKSVTVGKTAVRGGPLDYGKIHVHGPHP